MKLYLENSKEETSEGSESRMFFLLLLFRISTTISSESHSL